MKTKWLLLFLFANASSDYLILDENKLEYKLKGDKLCSSTSCMPLLFEPTETFRQVFPGQRIPKGLHVTMDFSTGVKMAKLMDGVERSDLSLSETGLEEEPKVIVNQGFEVEDLRTHLTMEEKTSLESIFSNLSPQQDSEAMNLALDQMEEVAHHVDVGIGIASSHDQIERLTTLLFHGNADVKSGVAMVFTSIFSNNRKAQEIVLKHTSRIIAILFDRYGAESDLGVKKRLISTLSSLIRGNQDAADQFSKLRPFDLLLRDSGVIELEDKIYDFVIDISYLLETGALDERWCQKGREGLKCGAR